MCEAYYAFTYAQFSIFYVNIQSFASFYMPVFLMHIIEGLVRWVYSFSLFHVPSTKPIPPVAGDGKPPVKKEVDRTRLFRIEEVEPLIHILQFSYRREFG